MKLSVIIPARDEAGSLATTVSEVASALEREGADYEILVVDDASEDGTGEVARGLAAANGHVRALASPSPPGFGFAVRAGLDQYDGDAVAIAMADGSDDPTDLVTYYRLLSRGADCVFGSRFVPGAQVSDYPKVKLALNRAANWGIRALFRHGYTDTTNAFKAYRREVIDGMRPLLSNHFNLTVEMPLKAVARGYDFRVVPISWRGRSSGTSKLALKEIGSRYVFIILYVFLEKHLSRGDYRRAPTGVSRA